MKTNFRNQLGYVTGVQGLHICGYTKDSVLFQDNRYTTGNQRKAKLYTNKSGTYFMFCGKRVYLERKIKMEKLTLSELSKAKGWKEAVVVFTEDTWEKVYSLDSRSYAVSHDAKYFDPNMIGNSLFGNALDGTDNGVRLDIYMGDGWKVDYCYIVK